MDCLFLSLPKFIFYLDLFNQEIFMVSEIILMVMVQKVYHSQEFPVVSPSANIISTWHIQSKCSCGSARRLRAGACLPRDKDTNPGWCRKKCQAHLSRGAHSFKNKAAWGQGSLKVLRDGTSNLYSRSGLIATSRMWLLSTWNVASSSWDVL